MKRLITIAPALPGLRHDKRNPE